MPAGARDEHQRLAEDAEFDDPEIWDYLGADGFSFGTVLTFGDKWAAYIGPVADYTMFETKEDAMEWVLTKKFDRQLGPYCERCPQRRVKGTLRCSEHAR